MAREVSEDVQAFQKCETAWRNAVTDDQRERAAIAGFWNARNVIPSLLEVVRAVAEGHPIFTPMGEWGVSCAGMVSTASLIDQARAVLAAAETEGSSGDAR